MAQVANQTPLNEPQRAEPPARPPRGRASPLIWVAVAALVCGLLAVAVWRLGFSDSGPRPLTQADVDRAVKRGVQKAQEEQRNKPPDAAVAYQRIGPSLVTVTTEGGSCPTGRALGTGVIVSTQGAILTALHVVAGADKITVRFADGTDATAQLEHRQPAIDIAILVVDQFPGLVVPAVLAGAPEVGDDVFAVGHPLGLEGSLTAGIVSATDRTIRAEDGRNLGDLIQFDAAVNPGNSGGPLLNPRGQVVGIVTGLANPSGQEYFVGIGFAVPIPAALGGGGEPQQ